MLRLFLIFVLIATSASAQERRPSHCIAIAESAPGIRYAQAGPIQPPGDEFSVAIRYIDHSMFLIQTHGGLSVITDYNGFIGPTRLIPDVVTMNNAHGTHWTHVPDPAIPHVLEGWAEGEVAAEHHLDLGEMLIRNVPTDVRDRMGGVRVAGNSIFVFEVAGLCIGHLGHLHHEPDELQYAALGRLDVVMAAVDGGLTLDLPTMTRVLNRLKSSIVIPMHWFGLPSLQQFMFRMREGFDIVVSDTPQIEISLRTLPSRPTVIALPPMFLSGE